MKKLALILSLLFSPALLYAGNYVVNGNNVLLPDSCAQAQGTVLSANGDCSNSWVSPNSVENAVLNQNTLQSGATFYVSSGTIAGQFNINNLSATNTKGVVVQSTGSANDLYIQSFGSKGTNGSTSGAVFLDLSHVDGYGLNLYSNLAQSALDGLLNLNVASAWNEPVFYIADTTAGTDGHPQIRIDAANPNVELINTNLGGTVKYEIAVPRLADYLQVNGRDPSLSQFTGIARFHRFGGNQAGALGFNALQMLTTGQVLWDDTTDNHYVGFVASNTVSANVVWTLPSADGSAGTMMVTNGSKVLSFTNTPVASTANSYEIAFTTTSGQFHVAVSTSGHFITGGTTPVISSCGSTPSGSVVGDDNRGTITVGGGSVTACTLTFNKTWGTTPTCVISDNSTAITGDISSISATAFTASFSLSLGGGLIYYQCGCSGPSCL